MLHIVQVMKKSFYSFAVPFVILSDGEYTELGTDVMPCRDIIFVPVVGEYAVRPGP